MELKKIKVIRKTDYQSDKYYIKFKRYFLGFIPMWFYLRNGHLKKPYKINKYFIHINIILIGAFILGIKSLGWEPGAYPILLIILLFYNIFYLTEQIGSDKIYIFASSYDTEDTVKKFGDKNIKKFNNIHSSKNKRVEVVYRNDNYDSRYYDIKIPRINFKKFIY